MLRLRPVRSLPGRRRAHLARTGRRLAVRAEPPALSDDRCIVEAPEADARLAAIAALAALSVRRRAGRWRPG
jgi:hypothetical protein